MGHLINPARFRLGNSILWDNNWPATEEYRYLYYYNLHQELDQFFKTLFFETLQNRLSFRQNTDLMYSGLTLNLIGFDTKTLILDVSVCDFLLAEYIDTYFSYQNEEDKRIPRLLYKIRKFLKLDFFIKHRKILEKINKNIFSLILNKHRRKFKLFFHLFVQRIKKWLITYQRLIYKKLFAFYNHPKLMFDKRRLHNLEHFLIQALPLKERKEQLNQYWLEKYKILNDENTLLQEKHLFTSEFPEALISKEEFKKSKNFVKKVVSIKKKEKEYTKTELTTLIKEEIELRNKVFSNYLIDRNNLILYAFPYKKAKKIIPRFKKKVIQQISETHKNLYFQQNSNALEIPKINTSENNTSIDYFVKKINKLYNTNSYFFNNNNKKTTYKLYSEIFKSLQFPYITKDYSNFTHTQLDYLFDNIKKNEKFLPEQIVNKIASLPKQNYYEEIKSLLQFIDEKVTIFVNKNLQKIKKNKIKSFSIDPFYLKYMAYKNIKNIILNLNISTGHNNIHVSARFIALFIKRLFVRKKPVWYINSAVKRILRRITYLQGYQIIFAGRFTRAQYATYKITKKGSLGFSNMSLITDYATIGFTGKFGYCGIKILLQYTKNALHSNILKNNLNHAILPISFSPVISTYNKQTLKTETLSNTLYKNKTLPYYD